MARTRRQKLDRYSALGFIHRELPHIVTPKLTKEMKKLEEELR